jgi:hypothetical protein
MLNLNGLTPFAQGSNRFCFVHPADPDVCMKVIRPENIELRFSRQSVLKKCLGKERLNDNNQELAAYRQSAIRSLNAAGQPSLAWSHLPEFFGSIETSMGPANASELIRCADGTIAPTLEGLLKRDGYTPMLQAAADRFTLWLQTHGILARNLLPHNLVLSDRSGTAELFLVDGLGAPLFQNQMARMRRWRNHYISRKTERFKQRIQWEAQGRNISWEAFQKTQ